MQLDKFINKETRMFNQIQSLAEEFPEFKDAIHNLKSADAHFGKLFDQYDEVNKQLHRIAEEIETPSDDVVEQIKKQRLSSKMSCMLS
jgi:uncharacterized protein YdcH (DUF465 family)